MEAGGTPASALPQLTLGGLEDAHADALASLLPLLGCGEEAAVLSFDRLSEERGFSAAARYALTAIASEERLHDRLIAAMRAALPVRNLPLPLEQKARRMHLSIGRGEPVIVLARIAALDAAVCTLLSRLAAPPAPLSRSIGFGEALARIRSDEARHVHATRSLVLAHGAVPRTVLEDEALAVRAGLAALLESADATFEALGVDFDALMQAIRRVPPGLFRT